MVKITKPNQAFSLIELSIVVLIIGVVTIVALNGKSLVTKANCVVSSFGSKTITDNLNNPTALTKNKSTAYENCVASGGPANVIVNCSGGLTCNSCKAVLDDNPGVSSGTYTIDPDGTGGNPSFTAYCDMETDGGGWTLVLKNVVANNDFIYSSNNWINGTVFNSSDFNLWSGSNALYQSYNTVVGNKFRVEFQFNGSFTVTTPTADTAKAKANGATYREVECSTSGVCWGSSSANCSTLKNSFHSTWKLQDNYVVKLINRSTGSINSTRFGILANDQNTDEGSMDSVLGVGLNINNITSGNYVSCCTGSSCDPNPSVANNQLFWKALLWVK